ncbi:hypothetical protein LJR039_005449 [Pseudorhodoferax sp. LjRoot39]
MGKLVFYPVMRLLVFRLHEKGCPLNYGQVLTRSKLVGTMVYEKADRANQVARLYREDGWQIAELRRAVIVRISNGCMLLKGVEPSLNLPAPRQTWLCGLVHPGCAFYRLTPAIYRVHNK